MPALNIDAFSAASPQAWYLGDQLEKMEALSDAALLVAGTRLPVHRSILTMQSGVLAEMFAGCTAHAPKRPRTDDQVGSFGAGLLCGDSA